VDRFLRHKTKFGVIVETGFGDIFNPFLEGYVGVALLEILEEFAPQPIKLSGFLEIVNKPFRILGGHASFEEILLQRNNDDNDNLQPANDMGFEAPVPG